MMRWLAWFRPWWWPLELLEPGSAPGARGLDAADTAESFLGLGWHAWGRLAVVSWLVLFAAAWLGTLRTWEDSETAELGWTWGLALAGVATSNGLPGAAALFLPALRSHLRRMPEAAALGLLMLSALLGIGGFALLGLWAGDSTRLIGAGIVMGVMSFPLTFGLAFPLAIPLVCAFVAWAWTEAHGGISRLAFGLLAGVSALGWMGVVLVGMAMGVGG